MISISNEANQLILGGLLGDASINRIHAKPRIHFCHSLQQEEYIRWKYEILKQEQLTDTEPKVVISKQYNKKYPQLRFQTNTSANLEPYERLFYPNGKKRLRRKILNMLDPLGLAVWYMDDGNVIIHKYNKQDGTRGIKSRELVINTQCFSYEEHKIIQRYFKVQWDIDVKIYKNKSNYRIAMNATNAKKFIAIIEPHILPSMKYKIDLKYV